MCLKQKRYIIHLLVFILLAGISLVITLLFPIYFRNDDGTNIYWAATHKFIEVFNLGKVTFSDTLRPVFFAFWWLMYKCFGHNSFYYQFFVIFIFLATLYLFYLVCRNYAGKHVGLLAFLFHIFFFKNLYYVAFWFSDTTFTIQLFFTLLSILFYFKSKTSSRHIILSYLFAFMAFLTKEPSIFIIISFLLADTLVTSKHGFEKKRLLILLPYILSSLIILFYSPTFTGRPLSYVGLATYFQKIIFRADFYNEYILSGIGIIIPFVITLSIISFINLKNYKILILLILLTGLAYYFTWGFYFFIIVSSIILIYYNKNIFPAFLWFILTLIPLFFLKFYTPTYLFEFSFGFSLFLGLAFSALYKKLLSVFQSIKHSNYRILILVSTIIILTLFPVTEGINQVKALRNIVNARQNFAAAIRYIESNKSDIEQIVVMNRKIKGKRKKREHKLSNSIHKSVSQQTMEYPHIARFIKSKNMAHIEIQTHTDYLKNSNTNPKNILLLQNNKDIKIAMQLNMIADTLFIYSHNSKDKILISRLSY